MGNALFQIAATIGYAKKYDVPFVFPKWEHQDQVTLSSEYFGHDIRSKNTYEEQCYKYSEIPFKPNLNIHGYFQSYKYFEHCQDYIKEVLSPLEPEDPMLFLDTCSIHVRRTDYLKFPKHHPILDMSYYEKAMDIVPCNNFVVFSDDVKWCKDNFKDSRVIVSDVADMYTDFKMMIACQPGNTIIKTSYGDIPIKDIKTGDIVWSYNGTKHISKLIGLSEKCSGRKVTQIGRRHYSGNIVCVSTGEKQTKYTPNHHCIAKPGIAFKHKHVLYLMKKGKQYRIGISSPSKTKRSRKINIVGFSDPRIRLNIEGGDSLWVLRVFDTLEQARFYEDFTSYKFGIPQTLFERRDGTKQKENDMFWKMFGENEECAINCLEHYNRDIKFPFYKKSKRNVFVGDKEQIIRACNLLDGMFVLDCDKYVKYGGSGVCSQAWVPIIISHEKYNDFVYSITVDKNHTYIGDGIVTHNCQHSITANSSFSWWAAWLGGDDKTVVAPKNWFGSALTPTHPIDDLIPNDWHLV